MRLINFIEIGWNFDLYDFSNVTFSDEEEKREKKPLKKTKNKNKQKPDS